MPAFLIADVAVDDLDAYRASGYLEAAREIAARYGGRYRARGGASETLEGDWTPARLVLIEFPDMERLRAFWNSEDYAPWRAVRERHARSRIIATEGLDGS